MTCRQTHPVIGDVRGLGLMIAVEFVDSKGEPYPTAVAEGDRQLLCGECAPDQLRHVRSGDSGDSTAGDRSQAGQRIPRHLRTSGRRDLAHVAQTKTSPSADVSRSDVFVYLDYVFEDLIVATKIGPMPFREAFINVHDRRCY